MTSAGMSPWLALAILGVLICGSAAANTSQAVCPGYLDVQGLGDVHLVPTGWGMKEEVPPPRVSNGILEPTMGSRAYFASTCNAGVYDRMQYAALDFRGKTLRYTTDVSGAGCGCNAALYLASLRQNERIGDCGDYYCDANNVCNSSCAEIDIQEGNKFTWHSTLHGPTDGFGTGKGYGGGGRFWNGFRDWDGEDFGPGGRCIDTEKPFQVAVSFPVDANGSLRSMDVRLTQFGGGCPMNLSISSYSHMAELDAALTAGMTPIVSYWNSTDMLWMDGAGKDGKGPCKQDLVVPCAEAVRFYDFSVTPAFPGRDDVTVIVRDAPPHAERARGDGSRRHAALALAALAVLAAVLLGILAVRARGSCKKVVKDCELHTCSQQLTRKMRTDSSQSLLKAAYSSEREVRIPERGLAIP